MGGAKKRPVYKIVVADSRFPRDGRFIEKIGLFNPLLPKDRKERIKIETERVKYWISKGARPTMRVSRILGEAKVMPMPKAGNNPQKAIQWLNELGNPYSKVAVDSNGRIGLDWGVYGLPETFIVNENNIILYKQVGPITNEKYDNFYMLIEDSIK